MPIEFNPERKISKGDALSKEPLLPTIFSVSADSAVKSFLLFNRDKEQSKTLLEIEMMVDQPHLHEFLSTQLCRKNVLNKSDRRKHQEAYREGAMFTYAILSTDAVSKGDGLPLILPIDKKLYKQDFKIRHSDTLFEIPIQTLNDRMNTIFQADPGLEKPIKAQKQVGTTEYYPFRRGVVDTHYAISNTIINRAMEEKLL